jgi:Ca-activated chloride channel homolog
MRLPSLILVLIAACFFTAAQQPQPTTPPAAPPQQTSAGNGDQPTSKIVTSVDVVNVVFTVQDDQGRFVKDLTKNDFRVLDNNLPPKEVTSFDAPTGLPLRIGLLIDASNSIRERFKFEQDAATEFLEQTLNPDTDTGMVESFDEIYEVVQDFTNDRDKLAASLHKISAGGSTAMWDAVYYACREKLMKQHNPGPVRNVIVLISDGNDTQSHVTRQEAVDMAERADVTIYTVSTGLGFGREEGDHNLKLLADATGGRSFFPATLQDIATSFVHIQHELRSQYVISYKPDNFVPNGQFHAVSIKTIHGGFKVRARKGYYARKQ